MHLSCFLIRIPPLTASMKQTSGNYKSCKHCASWVQSWFSDDYGCSQLQCRYHSYRILPLFSLRYQRQFYSRYDCHHLKVLPADKCVVNDNEYVIGESLKEEDGTACDIGCVCSQGDNNTGPAFTCEKVDCFSSKPPRIQPGCYDKRSAMTCCIEGSVCPKKSEDIPTCTVDGKIYKDGELFLPASEPKKYCYCGAEYTGDNIAPFCRKYKSLCKTMLYHSNDVRQNCVPTYYHSQSLKTACSLSFRCQNDNDVVIARSTNFPNETKSVTNDPGMQCIFGNLTMNVGDELNQATDWTSVCVKCVCQVPPVPSCQRLSRAECDVTNHRKFNTSRILTIADVLGW